MKVNGEGKRVPSDIDYIETWKGMEKCKNLGLTRSIGVSNFNSEQIKRLVNSSEIKPANNQVINEKKFIIDFYVLVFIKNF